MVVIGFSRIFSDMGISNVIIHKQDISSVQLSSLYRLNIASGTILFVIISLLSPLIASFYNQPQLILLLILVALTFIISSFGNQFKILFQKELNFNLIAKIEIFVAINAFVVALLFASNNYGVFSLVYARLTSTTLTSILFVYFGIQKHKPMLIYKYSEIKSFFSFGLFQVGEHILNYFSSQFDVILIGKLLGTDTLGIYSVAKNLAMRPMQVINPIITRVTFPLMAKVQDDNKELKNIYLKSLNYLSAVNFPIYMLIALLAEPIISIIFGNKWHSASDILQILCFYAMFRSIGNPIGTLQLAKGRADMGFYWDLGVFVLFPISIYIGTTWGLIGVSYGMLIIMIVQILLMWIFMIKKLCGASFTEYIKSFGIALVLSSIIWLVSFSIFSLIENETLKIVIILCVSILFYWKLTKKYNSDILFMLKEFRK
jgi:O-antigen/teichoic acid export membrane protein